MDKYYYLVSQLPILNFGLKTYMTTEYFLDQARKWLDGKDFSLLSGASLSDFSRIPDESGILKEYKNFELNLRRELTLVRKSKKEKYDYKPEVFSLSLIKEANPLEAEKELLKLRWEYLERKEQGHYFDLTFIVIYFLKLQIMQRLFIFDKDKGIENFHKFCAVSYG